MGPYQRRRLDPARRTRRLREGFNPKQRRYPKGNPRGGQFAPAKGGGGAGMAGGVGSWDNPVGLSDSPIVAEEHLGGGINETRLIHYEDGTVGVWKSPSQREVTDEVSAYLLDEELGLGVVPRTVYGVDSKGRVGSVQKFVEGEVGEEAARRIYREYVKMDGPGDYKYDVADDFQIEFLGGMGGGKIAELDFVIYNSDRHLNNLLSSKGRLYAIDNGDSGQLRGTVVQSQMFDMYAGTEIEADWGKVTPAAWDRITQFGKASWSGPGYTRVRKMAESGIIGGEEYRGWDPYMSDALGVVDELLFMDFTDGE